MKGGKDKPLKIRIQLSNLTSKKRQEPCCSISIQIIGDLFHVKVL